VSAKLILRGKEYEVEAGTTILYALVRLGIDIRVVRPMRDGELIGVQEPLRDGDVVQLVAIVSGGE
jgi:sulfur carrier protein ThiS